MFSGRGCLGCYKKWENLAHLHLLWLSHTLRQQFLICNDLYLPPPPLHPEIKLIMLIMITRYKVVHLTLSERKSFISCTRNTSTVNLTAHEFTLHWTLVMSMYRDSNLSRLSLKKSPRTSRNFRECCKTFLSVVKPISVLFIELVFILSTFSLIYLISKTIEPKCK